MAYFLYLTIAVVVLLGIISRGWLFTTFRSRVGNFWFSLSVLVEIVIFVAILFLVDIDYSVSTKLSAIAGMLVIDVLLTTCMYKKARHNL